MRTYLSVMNDDLARVLEGAESLTTTVTIEMLERACPDITTYVRQAHHQLAVTCKGRAFGKVKAVERNNAVEVWRCRFQRCEADAGPRLQNMMTRALQPGHTLESPAGFESALVGWDGLMDEWENASGNLMDEPVKIAMLLSRALAAINGFFQLKGITTFPRMLKKFRSRISFHKPKTLIILLVSRLLRGESLPCRSMRSLNTRAQESNKRAWEMAKRKGREESKTKDEKLGAACGRTTMSIADMLQQLAPQRLHRGCPHLFRDSPNRTSWGR